MGHLFDLSPAAVCAAVRDQRLALTRPARSVRELLDTLFVPRTRRNRRGSGNHAGFAVGAVITRKTCEADLATRAPHVRALRRVRAATGGSDLTFCAASKAVIAQPQVRTVWPEVVLEVRRRQPRRVRRASTSMPRRAWRTSRPRHQCLAVESRTSGVLSQVACRPM